MACLVVAPGVAHLQELGRRWLAERLVGYWLAALSEGPLSGETQGPFP